MTPFLGLLFALVTAQQHPAVQLSGRVIRLAGQDTLAVPAARVVLHRVTQARQGPIDSMITDAQGRFRFVVRPDSGDIYLASARRGGVEYFGLPLPASMLTSDQSLVVLVSDTSSTAPLTLVARQLVIVSPATDGTREVVDALTLANPGQVTRVIDGRTGTAWRFLLPPGALSPHVDDSDFAIESFTQRGDTVLLQAAIPPGKHAILVSYHLPAQARRFAFPSLDIAEQVTVMAQEDGLRPEHLSAGERRELDGKHFTEWSGPGDSTLVIALPWDGSAPTWLLSAMVIVVGAVLLGVSVMAIRRRAPAQAATGVVPPSALPAGAEALLRRIAALDAGEPGGGDPGERSRLKDELTRLLRGDREENNGAPPPLG